MGKNLSIEFKIKCVENTNFISFYAKQNILKRRKKIFVVKKNKRIYKCPKDVAFIQDAKLLQINIHKLLWIAYELTYRYKMKFRLCN